MQSMEAAVHEPVPLPPVLALIDERVRAAGWTEDDLIPEYRTAVAKAAAFAAAWQVQLAEQKVRAQKAQETAMLARVLHVCSRAYVGSLPLDITREEIMPLFTAFGGVKQIDLTMDPATGRSKGFCFVEYEVPDAVPTAITTMNGSTVGGRTIKVGRPSNYPTTPHGGLPPPDGRRVFLSNVHAAVGESDLSAIFEPFGNVVQCSLSTKPRDDARPGFGFIEFEDAASAMTAASSMDGFLLAGRPLLVKPAVTSIPIEQLLALTPLVGAPVALAPPTNGAAGPDATRAAALGVAASLVSQVQESSSLRSEEEVSISNSSQRIQLIQRLARTVSQTLLFLNMASLREMDDELKEDIVSEVNKVDRVLDIQMVPTGQDGESLVRVLIRLSSLEGAKKVRDAFDKRFFSGRVIAVSYYDDNLFMAGKYMENPLP